MKVLTYKDELGSFVATTESTGRQLKGSKDDYYVYDPKHDVMCIVEFGLHIIGILYLLKHYYDFKFSNSETRLDYQKIIEGFEICSAFKEPEEYAIDVSEDGVYFASMIKNPLEL